MGNRPPRTCLKIIRFLCAPYTNVCRAFFDARIFREKRLRKTVPPPDVSGTILTPEVKNIAE